MTRRKIILGLTICLSIAVLVAQSLSQTRNPGRTRTMPEWDRLRSMTAEERKKEMRRWFKQRREQMQIQRQREIAQARNEANRQLIGATKRQWLAIRPKMEKVRHAQKLVWVAIHLNYFKDDSNSNSDKTGSQSEYKYSWKWDRPSERKKSNEGDSIAKSIDTISDPKISEELTRGEGICEELLTLLEDKNSSEEDIREKVEALRNFRQKAKEQLAKAQQELRQVVTTLRQEAVLVWKGLLP